MPSDVNSRRIDSCRRKRSAVLVEPLRRTSEIRLVTPCMMELLRRWSGGKAGCAVVRTSAAASSSAGCTLWEPHTPPIDTRRRDRVATHQVGYTPLCGRSERQFEAVPRSCCGPTSRLSLPPRDEHVEIAREALRGTARGHRLRFRASRAALPRPIRVRGVAASHSVKLGLRPCAARGRSCRVGNASARCGSGTRQREWQRPQDGTDPRDRHAHRVSRRARSAYRLFFPNR